MERKRKGHSLLFALGIVAVLGSLAFFKYFNFLVNTANDIFSHLNLHLTFNTVHILLPLGISFYTFRLVSYLLDINKGKIHASNDFIGFILYATFFPSVISGPIDRASDFLPQVQKKRTFDYAQASDGMRQLLWGIFKKIVIADNCAIMTGGIFSHYQTMPASALLFAAVIYSFEMYADFSGYSDMAIGIANLLGFRLTRNFAYPFFAENIAEYWRRWHISLTSWLTEYVFTPLSIFFRDYGRTGLVLAILINFTLIGLWHGANWTYVVFGILHSCYFIPLIVTGKFGKRKKAVKGFSFRRLLNRIGTFCLATIAFIVFRANNLHDVFTYIMRLFSPSIFYRFKLVNAITSIVAMICIVIMMVAEWYQRDREHALQIGFIKKFAWRAIIYFSLVLIILFFRASATQDFIYFKF